MNILRYSHVPANGRQYDLQLGSTDGRPIYIGVSRDELIELRDEIDRVLPDECRHEIQRSSCPDCG